MLRDLLVVGLSLVPLALSAQEGLLNRAVLEQVARGLFRPTSISHAGDGSGRLFVAEQSGAVRVVDKGGLVEEPFLDIGSQTTCCGELGLLGIAFHPRYQQNGYFYVFYSDSEGTSVVSRFEAKAGSSVADPSSESMLLRIEQPSPQHQGGQLQFGPDGLLYVSVGDGGPAASENPNAQRRDSLLGKLLRIDVDAADPYAVPSDNPFADEEDSRGEIWTYGLRNPWRFSFDRATGDLFIADVGFAEREEINFQPAGSAGGENYGWSVMEGSRCTDGSTDCNLFEDFAEPILDYGHDAGCSVIGGYVYRGAALPALQGAYLYGDFCSGEIWAARNAGGAWEVVDSRSTNFSITTLGEDEAGELYVADLGGEVYRIAAADAPPTVSFAYPSRAIAGGPSVPIYLVGGNFVTGMEVRWNGQPRPNLVLDNQMVRVELTRGDIAAAGSAEVTVVNPALPDAEPARLEFPVDAPGALSPRLNAAGIVTAAGFHSGALAPGSIAAVFGVDLAAFIEAPPRTPLPRMAGGSGILFAGQHWAPLFFAAPLQMNVQIPWELAGLGEATVQLRLGSAVSEAVTVPIAKQAPAVFLLPTMRSGQGAILIGDSGGVVAAPAGAGARTRPLRGGELITIYLTGLGPVSNQPASGRPAGTFPLSETTTRPEVEVGGVGARVFFSGLAPGSVGLYQINALTSAETPSGDEVPVVVSIGGASSVPVIIAVE